MKHVKKFLGIASILAVIGFITLFLTGCPQESDNGGNVTTTVSVTGVTLNQKSISLAMGGTATLTATIAPENATNKAVSWSSSDPTKATVSNGVVTAVAKGSATITVTTADGGKTDTCTITVTDGGSTTSTFAITMQNDGNGTATASPNPAKQGDEVTITAEHNSGYSFESWQVVSGGITLSHNTANPSIFTMPGNAVTIKATFALIPPNTPALSITPPTFADVTIGYAAQSAKNVTITNEGTGLATITSIALDSAGNTAFTLGGTSITTVAAGGTATFTVQPKIGLAVGTYEGTITVTYDSGKKAEAEVSFTVTNTTFNVTNAVEWNAATAAIAGGGNDKTYDINVTGNFSIQNYSSNTFGNVTGITVNIRGAGTITLSSGSTGSLLVIGTNQTVSLRETHLKGHSTNDTSLVYIYNGTFNMSGGTISDNTANSGGGVHVGYSGTFNMTGGTISGNTSTGSGRSNEDVGGGGVWVSGSEEWLGGVGQSSAFAATFNMSGGNITGNKASIGGGVNLGRGHSTFNMSGGTISGNTATHEGGGVFFSFASSAPCTVKFIMTGGIITGNTAFDGGGVWGQGPCIFDLKSFNLVINNTTTTTEIEVDSQVYIGSPSPNCFLINGNPPDPSLKCDEYWWN